MVCFSPHLKNKRAGLLAYLFTIYEKHVQGKCFSQSFASITPEVTLVIQAGAWPAGIVPG